MKDLNKGNIDMAEGLRIFNLRKKLLEIEKQREIKLSK